MGIRPSAPALDLPGWTIWPTSKLAYDKTIGDFHLVASQQAHDWWVITITSDVENSKIVFTQDASSGRSAMRRGEIWASYHQGSGS